MDFFGVSNTSLSNQALPKDICENITKLGRFHTALAVYNGMIAILNVFHIIFLYRANNMRRSAHFKLLIMMAIIDIEFGIFSMIELMIDDRFLTRSIIATLTNIPAHAMKFIILACASYDRYKAICDPFFHASSSFLRNIVTILVLGNLFLMAANAPSIYIAAKENDCVIFLSSLTWYNYIYTFVFIGTPLAFTIILSGLVLRELFRMSKRVTSLEDRAVKNSALYILAVIVVLVISVVPEIVNDFTKAKPVALYIKDSRIDGNTSTLINTITRATNKASEISFSDVSEILFYSYGLLNILIYGLMNGAYRREISSLICQRSASRQVDPPTLSTADEGTIEA